MIRLMALVLLLLIIALQLRLWGSDGRTRIEELEQAIAAQQAENERLRQRNAALQAEVVNLKEGHEAIEERARAELGLIGPDEIFYHVIDRPGGPARDSAPGSQASPPPEPRR